MTTGIRRRLSALEVATKASGKNGLVVLPISEGETEEEVLSRAELPANFRGLMIFVMRYGAAETAGPPCSND